MSKLYIVGVFACTLLMGCGDPNSFKLHENSYYPVEGRVLRDRHAVAIHEPNVVGTHDTSAVALRVPGLTDGTFSTELTLSKGGTVTVFTRATPYGMQMRADSGIRIEITNDVTTVTTPDGKVFVGAEGAQSSPKPLRIVNDGVWCTVIMGCTNVARVRTPRTCTEWIIAASSASSTFEMRDPIFTPLIEM
ncbi:hypothetical protein BH10BAC6_BH10BAC6_14990 [soil metagenome]